jgi:hypothetical protein
MWHFYTISINSIKKTDKVKLTEWLWKYTVSISDFKKHVFRNTNLFPSFVSLFQYNHWTRNFRLDRVSGVEDTRRCEWLQRHRTEWRLIAAVAETFRFTEAASVFAEPRGKLRGLKIFLSQGKRPVSWNPPAIITPVAALLFTFPNTSSSPIW